MDNNINNDQQLEQMRQQMTELKQQLDRQEIVNEQLLRQSMTSKMSWIKRYVWLEIAFIPIVLLILAPIHAMLGLSWWLYGFLAVMLVVDVAADWRINCVDRNQLLTGNLVEASRRLTAMKRQRAWAFVLGIVGVVIWIAWFLFELKLAQGIQANDFLNGFAMGGFFGGIIGGVIGLIAAIIIFYKMQRTNDEVLAQIDQLTQ